MVSTEVARHPSEAQKRCCPSALRGRSTRKIKGFPRKYWILLIIFAIALVSSILLSQNIACTSEQNTCTQVQNSSYKFLPGINNSYYGTTIFLFLILVTLSQIHKPEKYKKQIIHYGIIFSAIIALYFLYIQQFILQTYCKYCVVIDTSLLISFLVIIFNWDK